MRPSLSGFVIFAAGTLDPRAEGLGHEAFVYRHWDHDATYEDILAGRPGGTWFSFPTMHDPSLAPEGEHILMFSALAPYDAATPWDELKESFQEQMLELAESVLPGYRDALTFVESATPLTFERYTLSQKGAAYGWENTPDQTTPKRLDNRSPIPGLYLAGHWSQPGPASVRCLFSGVQAASIICEADDPIAFLGTLAA
jgi:phytoene dehydrogenase-like protein